MQYGWSGNGGYFDFLGSRLLDWYDAKDEEMIEYLFSIGQFAVLGKPHSEETNPYYILSTKPTGEPHNVGTSEKQIFSKIHFVNYGYFYDLDQEWYYIVPGPFRIKIPLQLIANNVDGSNREFAFLKKIERLIIEYIFIHYPKLDSEFQEFLAGMDADKIFNCICSDRFPIGYLFDNHRKIFSYFDDWIVVKCDEEYKDITSIIMKKHEDQHIETIYWSE